MNADPSLTDHQLLEQVHFSVVSLEESSSVETLACYKYHKCCKRVSSGRKDIAVTFSFKFSQDTPDDPWNS